MKGMTVEEPLILLNKHVLVDVTRQPIYTVIQTCITRQTLDTEHYAEDSFVGVFSATFGYSSEPGVEFDGSEPKPFKTNDCTGKG